MNTNKILPSGLKKTAQRKKILEFIENTKSHPSADDIFNNVRKDMPNISRTTVYNTVNKLVKEGTIKCISTKNGEMRFDAYTDPHYHFMCDECGSLYDLGQAAGILQKEIDGHEIKDIFICYNGLCRQCREKKNKDLPPTVKDEMITDDDVVSE